MNKFFRLLLISVNHTEIKGFERRNYLLLLSLKFLQA